MRNDGCSYHISKGGILCWGLPFVTIYRNSWISWKKPCVLILQTARMKSKFPGMIMPCCFWMPLKKKWILILYCSISVCLVCWEPMSQQKCETRKAGRKSSFFRRAMSLQSMPSVSRPRITSSNRLHKNSLIRLWTGSWKASGSGIAKKSFSVLLGAAYRWKKSMTSCL